MQHFVAECKTPLLTLVVWHQDNADLHIRQGEEKLLVTQS